MINTKKCKILIDLTMLDQIHSGIGELNLNYGKLLSKNRIDNFEFTFLLPKEMIGIFGNSVKYVSSSRWRKKFPIFNKKYDLWHTTFQLSKFSPSPFVKNVVLTIHDLNFLYEKDSKSVKKEIERLQRKVNKASFITCISNFVVHEVKKNLKITDKSIKMIYNGVSDASEEIVKKPDFVGDKPFFFAIGEIVEKKNFHVLLEVMKFFPEYDLYICGIKNRSYANFIIDKISQASIHNIFLPGTISREEKVWFFSNCLALFHPSKLEGFGLPVIEAMKYGKPVFLSRLTSLPEIGGNVAFYFNNFEPEIMAETIKKGIYKYNIDPNIKITIQNWAKQFDYKIMVENHLKLYQEILK